MLEKAAAAVRANDCAEIGPLPSVSLDAMNFHEAGLIFQVIV